MPELDFELLDAEVLPFAVGPTMIFKLQMRNGVPGERIQSIMLNVQIRLEALRRHYDPATETRLLALFGEPQRWGSTLRSVLWTTTTALVPGFVDSAVVQIPIACSYDVEVAGIKYLFALEDGDVPVIFLFSGTIFYEGEGGALRVAQIPWEKEATFRFPVSLWREMMDRYFPNTAWLRLRRDVFDRLYAYMAQQTLPTWDAAVEQLLSVRPGEVER